MTTRSRGSSSPSPLSTDSRDPGTGQAPQAESPYPHHPVVVQGLLKAAAYPHKVQEVELVETHISFIFLTDGYVYKMKKPVDLRFLDFTTLEKRKHYCYREVELNRRIAPKVYLGVVEVREHEGTYFIHAAGNGPGETVDYAVKMRQLPKERTLSVLLKRGQVTTNDTCNLARMIAKFHANAETSSAISRAGSVAEVRRNVGENFAQTRSYIGTTISQQMYEDIRAYSEGFLEGEADLFEERILAGRVRDCHGDLHAEQIFLETTYVPGRISIIDCIEFNERFRHCDVAEDIAFLAMDLDFHDRPDLSRSLMEAYIEHSGDAGLKKVLNFYKAYRAYVRGKVNSFRIEDPKLTAEEKEAYVETAGTYFRLAHSYPWTAPGPRLILVTGLSGTGKSTITHELASRWDMRYISSDEVRKDLLGIPHQEHRYDGYGQGIYSPNHSLITYREMYRRTGGHLREGDSVVLDATFRRASDRAAAVAEVRRWGADVWIIECTLDEEEVRHRIGLRISSDASASDARWETYQRQRTEWEPVGEVANSRRIILDTGRPVDDLVRELVEEIHRTPSCLPEADVPIRGRTVDDSP